MSAPHLTPDLPNEIWYRIASFVPRMKRQPLWQAWQYRTLNHTFKKAIERYYVDHYLKYATIHVDCGMIYPDDYPELDCTLALSGGFEYDGFADDKKRVAVFREKEVAEAYWDIATEAFEDNAPDPGVDFHPKIVVQVRRGLTDLLPLDIDSKFERGDYTFKFDWRTYLCTFLDEQRQIDAENLSSMPAGLADDLGSQFRSGGLEMMTAMAKMIAAVADSHNKGVLAVRRKRRVRIGLKTQEHLRSAQEVLDRYARSYEEIVMKRVRDHQMGVNLEEFSDSDGEAEEEHAEAEGAKDEDFDEDEEMEWESADDEDIDEDPPKETDA